MNTIDPPFTIPIPQTPPVLRFGFQQLQATLHICHMLIGLLRRWQGYPEMGLGGGAQIVEMRAFPHPFESICPKSAKNIEQQKKWQTLWPALGGQVHGV